MIITIIIAIVPIIKSEIVSLVNSLVVKSKEKIFFLTYLTNIKFSIISQIIKTLIPENRMIK